MKKLKTVIHYECATSFKYIWYFYAILYGVIALLYGIIVISTGRTEQLGSNCLEINTVIYVSILGVCGLKDDFKMLLQNGFTRRYIFFATTAMFAFISGIVALIDMILGQLLHSWKPSYFSVFGSLYGYENLFMNWLWLFLFYLFVCCLLYFVTLVINKVGRNGSAFLGMALGGIILFGFALFHNVLSPDTVQDIKELAAKAMGFMSDGTIHYLFPVLVLLLLITVFEIAAYAMLRRTELHT